MFSRFPALRLGGLRQEGLRLGILALTAAAGLLCAPNLAHAQAVWGGPPIMICQTPQFWCAFPGQAADGLACYCSSTAGPVTGSTINPKALLLSAPPPATILPSQRPPYAPTTDQIGACLNGEALCEGDFIRSIRR